MRIVIGGIVSACLFTVVATAGERTTSAPSTVAEIRALDEIHRSLISTARVDERVIRRVRYTPDEEARRGAEREARLAEFFQRERAEHDANGGTEAEWRSIEDQVRSHYARSGRFELVHRLRSNVPLRRNFAVDFVTLRWRAEDSDLRDLAALAAEHALTVAERNNSDASRVRIFADGRLAEFNHHATRTATVWAGSGPDFEMEWLRVGVLPGWVFSEGTSLALTTAGDGEPRLTGRRGDAEFEARFDRLSGYRVSFFSIHRTTAVAEEFALSRFELTSDGVPVPRRVVQRHVASDGQETLANEAEIDSVTLNQILPAELFQLPTGRVVR